LKERENVSTPAAKSAEATVSPSNAVIDRPRKCILTGFLGSKICVGLSGNLPDMALILSYFMSDGIASNFYPVAAAHVVVPPLLLEARHIFIEIEVFTPRIEVGVWSWSLFTLAPETKLVGVTTSAVWTINQKCHAKFLL
jgi:hypothetical protein